MHAHVRLRVVWSKAASYLSIRQLQLDGLVDAGKLDVHDSRDLAIRNDIGNVGYRQGLAIGGSLSTRMRVSHTLSRCLRIRSFHIECTARSYLGSQMNVGDALVRLVG